MTWIPQYSRWRHGGWYVDNCRYPQGCVGCVSRNYPDKKWRIVCDDRPDAFERFTYASRDAAARAEYAVVQALRAEQPDLVDLDCELCGEPAGEGGAVCPACVANHGL